MRLMRRNCIHAHGLVLSVSHETEQTTSKSVAAPATAHSMPVIGTVSDMMPRSNGANM